MLFVTTKNINNYAPILHIFLLQRQGHNAQLYYAKLLALCTTLGHSDMFCKKNKPMTWLANYDYTNSNIICRKNGRGGGNRNPCKVEELTLGVTEFASVH